KGDFIKVDPESIKDIVDLGDIKFNDIKFGIGDFNADGFSDVMYYYIKDDKVYYQTLVFSKTGISAGVMKNSPKGEIPVENYISQLTDCNGDGVTDLLFTWTTDKSWFIKSYMFLNSQDMGLIEKP